jgi:hypothetical protein
MMALLRDAAVTLLQLAGFRQLVARLRGHVSSPSSPSCSSSRPCPLAHKPCHTHSAFD